MTIEIVREVIDKLEGIGDALYADLGYYGHAIAASIQYDARKAFDAAVAAGKFAVATFVAVGKQAIGDYWITIKDLLKKKGQVLKDMILTGGGMQVALTWLLNQLKSINWRDVAVSLTGIGESTLRASATAGLQMLISGILVAA